MKMKRVTKTVVSLGLIFLKFDEEIILLILFVIIRFVELFSFSKKEFKILMERSYDRF